MPTPISTNSRTATARRDVRWSGLEPDERRARRRALLVQAGFEILGSDGAAATTVRAVCQRAELNARYFYESFADIDALLIAVYDHVLAGLQEATAAVAASPDMAPIVVARIAVDAIVRFVDEDRRRARILYVEAVSNAALNRHRRATDIVAINALEQAAIEAAGAWPEGERVSQIGAAMLLGGMSEVLLDWVDGRIDVTRNQLVDDLAALGLALGEATEKIARSRQRR
ncbi:MAG TPA: TetR family transcriptional regulator [Acidimicrobiales bacterium]|nr:TetR family transcriptional regulator [Acidimicrobiales bacterium]